MPFYAWIEAKWTSLGTEERHYYALAFDIVDSALNFSSIVHLCILSVDRALAAAKPLYHRRFATRSRAMKILLLPWTINVVFALPYILLERTFLLYLIYFLILTVLFYLAPVVLISVSYAIIFKIVRQRNSSKLSTQKLNEMKLTRTIMAIIVAFLILWTPFVCQSGYILLTAYITGKRPSAAWWQVFIKLFSYLNSVVNPYIYAIFHSQFRKAFKDVIFMCKAKGIDDLEESTESKQYKDTKI